MSLSKRFFLIGSILFMSAFFFTFGPQTPSAHAASVSTSTHALTMTTSAISSLHGPQHELASVPAHALTMTTSDVSPDFTCPDRTVCLFQNDDFTGQVLTCATDVCRGAWFSTTVGGVHAGSMNDNSNSIVWVADKQAGVEKCFGPGRQPLDHMYGFFRAEFGVPSCPGTVPPLP